MFDIPQSVQTQYRALSDLMDKNPKSLSVSPTDAASVMGMDVECLKMSAYLGKCPFAIGGDSGPYTQRFTKIPKLPFFNFMMQGYWQFEMFSMMQQFIDEQNRLIIDFKKKVEKAA